MSDEALRQADHVLVEMAETVETARTLPMSTSCVLPRERMLDLIDELRDVLPAEMDQARSVVATRDRVLLEARQRAAGDRQDAVSRADAVLADAQHHAETLVADAETHARALVADAEERAAQLLAAASAERTRLAANTVVAQVADEAAAALRARTEQERHEVLRAAADYDRTLRDEADHYAATVRAAAEQEAHKLAGGAHEYARRTLDEVSVALHRAAAVTDQGLHTLAARSGGTGSGRGVTAGAALDQDRLSA